VNDGQKVAVEALSRVGTHESPWDSNTDGGGFIDQIEKFWGMHGEPWCAMYVSWAFRAAQVNDAGVISPATGVMCQIATQKGLWLPAGHPAPTGAIMILCDIHTEIVISQRASGLIDCVGGNVNQGVNKTVRALGGSWRCIVPPEVVAAPPAPIVVYGFDDPHFTPKRYGPWHDRDAREKRIHQLPHDQLRWVRRINVHGKNQYAFEILNPNKWHFGSWLDKGVRDQKMNAYEHSTGRQMRPWNQKVHPDEGTGSLTTGDTTT